ncbi:MAG: VCBS repeat-containing protein [Elusimicrobia bacterium]|nr:VCBS repeat-containing protein [Elusimicrobiota bacterium]
MSIPGTPAGNTGVAWGDIDSDGDLDAMFGNNGGGTAYLLRNDGSGGFTVSDPGASGCQAQGGAGFADLDGDGDADALLPCNNWLYRYLNQGGGSMVQASFGFNADGLALADFDEDGDMDAAFVPNANAPLRSGLLRNDGAGGLTAQTFAGSNYAGGAWGLGLSAGDYDGDGDLDLLAGYTSGAEVIRHDDAGPQGHSPPGAPSTGFGAQFEEYSVVSSSGLLSLLWDSATDFQSPASQLEYYVRLGTTAAGSSTRLKVPLRFSWDGAATARSQLYSTRLSQAQRGLKVAMQRGVTAYWAVVTEDGNMQRSAPSAEQTTYLIPPRAVTDLQVSAINSTGFGASMMSVTLTWTAPGEDEGGGTLGGAYDIRWSSVAPLASLSLYAAAPGQLVVSTSGVAPGSRQAMAVSGLSALTSWYFALTTKDSIGMRSGLSNQTTAVTGIFRVTVSTLPNSYPVWADFDNDGDLDLYVGRPNVGGGGGNYFPSYVFRNDGGVLTTTFPVAGQLINAGMPAVADFDNDGLLDVFATHINSAGDSYRSQLLLNRGAFQLQNVQNMNTVWDYAAAAADYDRDGDFDVAVVREAAGIYGIILANNSGNGTMTYINNPAWLTDGRYGTAWGDVDSDGDLDLAIPFDQNRQLMILRNDIPQISTFTWSQFAKNHYNQSFAWRDFDGDGDLDLASAGEGKCSIFRNDGLPEPSEFVLGTDPAALRLAWGDLDGDGDSDLLCGSSWFRYESGTTFTQIAITGNVAGSASLGDYDDDGDLDMAIANSNGVYLLRNDTEVGNSTPTAPAAGFSASFSDYGVGASSGLLTLSWGDGTDSETTNPQMLEYFVRIGTNGPGSGTFYRIPARYSLGSMGGSSYLYSTRLSTSQRGIRVSVTTSSVVYWAVVTEDAGFKRSPESAEQNISLVGPRAVTDLSVYSIVSTGLAASSTTVTLTWTAPGHDGDQLNLTGSYDVRWSSTAPITSTMAYAQAAFATTVATSAVTPGARQWASIPYLDAAVTYYFALTTKDDIGVRSGLSNPTTGPAYVVVIPSGGDSKGAAWGDYDGDGDLDVLVANDANQDEVLLRNDGGAFSVITIGSTGGQSHSVAWGDIDNDGDLDAVVANWAENAVLLRNTGGALSPEAIPGSSSSATAAAFGDFDMDGDLDVLISAVGDEVLLRNDGAGNFTAAVLTGTGGNSNSVAWGDYDNDGDLDALLVNFTDGGDPVGDEFLLRNDAGVLVKVALPGTGHNSSAGAWGDLDGDGDLDGLVVGANDPYVLRNDGGGAFTKLVLNGLGANDNALGLGDFDADGDLDAFVSAVNGATYMLRNDGLLSFSKLFLRGGGTDGWRLSASVGDSDGDGDLDVFVSGGAGGFNERVFVNRTDATHTPPSPPVAGFGSSYFTEYSATSSSGVLTLTWSDGSDAQTPDPDLLEYLVRLSTIDVAGSSSVYKVPPRFGNDGLGASSLYSTRLGGGQRGLRLVIQKGSTVHWGVTTVDPQGQRSAESAAQTFSAVVPAAPTLSLVDLDALSTSSTAWVRASWTAAAGASYYDVRWATYSLASPALYALASYRSTSSALSADLSVPPGRTWYFAVTAVSAQGLRSAPSNSISRHAAGLEVRTTVVSPAQELQDVTTAYLRLDLRSTGDTFSWQTLAVAKRGLLDDASVSDVGLYLDANSNGVFDGPGTDGKITANAVFSSSQVVLSISGGRLITAAQATFFLAMTPSTSFLPVAGATVSLSLSGQSFTVKGLTGLGYSPAAGVLAPDLPGLAFDGSDDTVTRAYDAGLDFGPALTLEAWFRSTATHAQTLVSRSAAAGASGVALSLNAGGCAGGGLKFSYGGAAACAAGLGAADGLWHHAAGVHAASGALLFLDGLPVATGTAAGSLSSVGSAMAAGRHPADGAPLLGELDEVRLSSSARYASAFVPTHRNSADAATAVLWHFDAADLDGTQAGDASGNARHGTLSGGVAGAARSGALAVLDKPDTLFTQAASLLPATMLRSDQNQAAFRLKLWTDGDAVVVSSLAVRRVGGADGDLSAVRLHRDDGDGVFSAATDPNLTPGQSFVSGSATIPLAGAGQAQTVFAATRTYFLVVDVSPSANSGSTLSLRLEGAGSLGVSGTTDTVSGINLPFETAVSTVFASTASVTVSLATGTWVSVSSVIAFADFPASTTYRYVLDHAAQTTVVLGDTQWSAGAATVPFSTSAADWYLHARSFDQASTPGQQTDLGPFWVDRDEPASSAFAALSSTGGAKAEAQFIDTTTAQVRLSVTDALSGLAVSSAGLTRLGNGNDVGPGAGGYGVLYSTDAGASWAAASTAVLVQSGQFVSAIGAFRDELYLGLASAQGVRRSTDGRNWGGAFGIGLGEVRSFAEYRGRLYASGAAGVVAYTSDGTNWQNSLSPPSEGTAWGLAVHGGGLYAAASSTDNTQGRVYRSTDGAAWTIVSTVTGQGFRALLSAKGFLLGGTSGGSPGVWSSADGVYWQRTLAAAEDVYTVIEHGGYVFALTPSYVYRSRDGLAWQLLSQPGHDIITAASAGGLLYGGSSNGALRVSPDGVRWAAVAGISGYLDATAAAYGRVYAGGAAGTFEVTPLPAALTGTDGTTAAQTLSATLPLAHSTNTTVCAGSWDCGATNMVVLTASDRAGNTRVSGPYAVRVDTTAPVVAMTSLGQVSGGLFATAQASDSPAGVSAYSFQASTAADFSGTVSSTPLTAVSSAVLTGLSPISTYYVRAAAQDAAGNIGTSVALSTFNAGIILSVSTSVAPGALLQGTSAAFLRLTLSVPPGDSVLLSSVAVFLLGTATDGDIQSIEVWNSSGAPLASAAPSGGTALVALGAQAPTLTPVALDLLVAVRVSPAAGVGKTVGLRLAASGLGARSGYGASGVFPADSSLASIQDGPSVLSVTPSNLAPAIVPPGTADALALRLAMTTDQGTSVLNRLVLRLTGTMPEGKVTAVKVRRDWNNNAVVEEQDVVLNGVAGSFIAGVSTLTLDAAQAHRLVSTAPAGLLVTLSLASDVNPGDTYRVILDTAGSVGVETSSDSVVLSTFPFFSSTVTVQGSNVLGVALADEAPQTLVQGESYTMVRATLTVDNGLAQVDRVALSRLGTGVDGDVSTAQVYLDATADGGAFNPLEDPLLGETALSAGAASVYLTTTTVNAGAPRVLLLRLGLSAFANAGNTAGLRLQSDAFRALSLQTAVVSSSFSTRVSSIAAVVNTMHLEVQDQSPGALVQGATNQAMLRLISRSDKNAFVWSGLTVTRLGSGSDADVAAVRFYKDSDGNGQLQPSVDTQLTNGTYTFTAGTAQLAFSPTQTVLAARSTYFVALDVSGSAVPGGTLGVSIATTSAFIVTSPNQVSTAAVPAQSALAPVSQYPNTVTLTTTSIAPASADPGQRDVGLARLDLRTDVSAASFLSLRVDRSGSLTDAEVSGVKLYADVNGLGTFNSQATGQFLLVTPATMTFASGSVVLPLGAQGALGTAAKTYFLAVDLSSAATPGRTLGAGALDRTYVSVGAPNTVAPTSFSIPELTVATPPSTLYLQAFSSAPAAAQQGDSGVVMMAVRTWMDRFSATLVQLSLTRSGTASDSDVTRARLYRDDGDGAFSTATDVQVASAAFSGAIAALTPPVTETVTTSTKAYFVVYDFSATATAGRTAGASVATPGAVVLGAPHSASPGAFPLSSTQTLISATVSGLSVQSLDRAPATVLQAATAQHMLTLTLATTQHALLLNGLTVTRLGTAGDSDIARLRVYRDDGDQAFEPESDSEVSSAANPFLSGTALVSFTPGLSVGVTPTRLFLALDAASYAVAQRTVGLSVSSTSALQVLAPNYVVDSGFPAASSLSELRKIPDTLTVTVSTPTSGDLIQGRSAAMVRVRAAASRDKTVMSSWRLTKLGTLPDGDVAGLSVYRDDDDDGTAGAADLFLGSGTFSAGALTVAFSSAQTVGRSTVSFLAVLTLSANATVGASLGLAVQDAAAFAVASPDAVSGPGLPFQTGVVLVLDAKTPTQPTLQFPDGAANGSFERMRFVWTSTVALGSLASAEYAVGTTPGGTQVKAWTAMTATPAEVVVTGLSLVSGTSYYVSARATSSFGFTSPVGMSGAQLADFTTPATPAPTASVGASSVLLNWSAVASGPSGIMGYLVEYRMVDRLVWINAKTGAASGSRASAAGATPAALSAVDLAGPPFLVTLPNGSVILRVTAVNGAGLLGVPSGEIKLQVGPLPADGVSNVSAFPNPFDSRKRGVNIAYALSHAAEVTLEIYDIFGREVLRKSFAAGGAGGQAGANVVTWDGTADGGGKVSMGVYLCVIRSGGAKVVHKIGVVH